MSPRLAGYLSCHDCQRALGLGEAAREGARPLYFHREGAAPNWRRELVNQALWRFLAAHAGHHIDVRLDPDRTEAMRAYREIGGDRPGDLDLASYVSDWPGLTPEDG